MGQRVDVLDVRDRGVRACGLGHPIEPLVVISMNRRQRLVHGVARIRIPLDRARQPDHSDDGGNRGRLRRAERTDCAIKAPLARRTVLKINGLRRATSGRTRDTTLIGGR